MNRKLAIIAMAGSLVLGLVACTSQAPVQDDTAVEQQTAAKDESSDSTDDEFLDSSSIFHAVFDVCPISSREAEGTLVGMIKDDGTRTVTFGSPYGDFEYVVDARTGEILKKSEPEITDEARAANSLLSSKEIKDIVFEVCPVSARDAYGTSMHYVKEDRTWNVTFGSPYGDFAYVVDAHSGEILDKDEPEVPDDAKSKDWGREARDACFAAVSCTGGASDIKVQIKGQQHKMARVMFEWNGKHYDMNYDYETKEVTSN